MVRYVGGPRACPSGPRIRKTKRDGQTKAFYSAPVDHNLMVYNVRFPNLSCSGQDRGACNHVLGNGFASYMGGAVALASGGEVRVQRGSARWLWGLGVQPPVWEGPGAL